MTYYAGLSYRDFTAGSTSTRNYQVPSFAITAGSSGLDASASSFDPIWISSNNSTLASNTTTYSGDYSNYVIVNNDVNNWVLTLPLGPGGTTTAWRSSSFQLIIKKTGSGTLTIQTPADTAGTRIRGINSTSNKSYTLSSSSEQSICLFYLSGKTNTGTIDSTAEIWFVV